jgi:hypothetical protein
MRTVDGGQQEIQVVPQGDRRFQLQPYPFQESSVTLAFPARHISGKIFADSAELQQQFADAPVEQLSVTVSA